MNTVHTSLFLLTCENVYSILYLEWYGKDHYIKNLSTTNNKPSRMDGWSRNTNTWPSSDHTPNEQKQSVIQLSQLAHSPPWPS